MQVSYFSLNFCLLILHVSVGAAHGSYYWWCSTGAFLFLAFLLHLLLGKFFVRKVLPHASFIELFSCLTAIISVNSWMIMFCFAL